MRMPIGRVRNRRGWLVALLVACLAIGIGLRLESVRHKHTPSHDESISFIAATCHQDAYEREAPVGRTVPASEWQRFWKTGDGTFCFAAIGRGLANTDLHPPLYFWLLHVWSLIFGVGLTQGVALNCFVVALTALALFGLGRTVFRSDWQAGVLAALWVLSPATVAISTEARQYDLFALVTVLFVWQAMRMTSRRRDFALLALAAGAGMLTHYLFALVIAGVLVIALVRRRFRATALPVLAGLVLAALLHPGFTHSLETARNRGGGSDSTGDRFERVLNTIGDYLTGHAVRHGKIVAIAMLLAFVALLVLRRRQREGWELPFMAVWLGGGIVLLYVAGLSPGHAMGASYLAPAWPFFGAAAILLLRDVRLQALAVVVMVVAGVVSAVSVDRANARLASPQKLLRGSDPILLANEKRGFVPPALWHVAPDRIVLGGDAPPPLLYITTRKANHGRLRGKIVLWDPENAVGGTAERVYRVNSR
jgi:uncharacterized membrane protein